MKRTLIFQVMEEEAGMTIEQFLRNKGCSHHVLTHLKRTKEGILQNGVWAYVNQLIKKEDKITVHIIEEDMSDHIVPVDLPLQIVYEDEDLMVVDKPCDMPIHPSLNNYENTLANAYMYYFQKQGIPCVYRCINRLDRDTSGLLILAKHMLSAAILSDMLKKREIHREYLAIVEGIVPEKGTIDAPIARMDNSVLMRCVDEKRGERAVTHYERVFAQNQTSLVRVHLETGRTHQIRVHMKHIGHPLLGDFLYNPDNNTVIQRQALHSQRLSFMHPIKKEKLTFESPLPPDMAQVMLFSEDSIHPPRRES